MFGLWNVYFTFGLVFSCLLIRVEVMLKPYAWLLFSLSSEFPILSFLMRSTKVDINKNIRFILHDVRACWLNMINEHDLVYCLWICTLRSSFMKFIKRSGLYFRVESIMQGLFNKDGGILVNLGDFRNVKCGNMISAIGFIASRITYGISYAEIGWLLFERLVTVTRYEEIVVGLKWFIASSNLYQIGSWSTIFKYLVLFCYNISNHIIFCYLHHWRRYINAKRNLYTNT